MVAGHGKATLPPRPMAEEAETQEAPLPWVVVPGALLLGTLAGGAPLAEAAKWAPGYPGAWVAPALRALAVGAVNGALAAAMAASDHVLARWRREVRWPLAVAELGVLSAGVLAFVSVYGPLQWVVVRMNVREALLLAAAGAVRGLVLAIVLALVCRWRRGLVWKAAVAGAVVEVGLRVAYLPVDAWLYRYQSLLPWSTQPWTPHWSPTVLSWAGPRPAWNPWRPLEMAWGDMGLVALCPAALALMVAVCGTLQVARARVGGIDAAPP